MALGTITATLSCCNSWRCKHRCTALEPACLLAQLLLLLLLLLTLLPQQRLPLFPECQLCSRQLIQHLLKVCRCAVPCLCSCPCQQLLLVVYQPCAQLLC
jgi:hypothetical protein